MNQIERLPTVVQTTNPVHPNAKSTTHMNNGTTTSKTNISTPVCRNCKTYTTPLWRRDETGQVLCNACGLFLKLHGRPRPISLKTDTIKSRNRIKQPNSSKSSGPNTPELKSKDSKVPGINGSGKKSPKTKKRSPTPVNGLHSEETTLTPLLPASASKSFSSNGSYNTPMSYNQHLSQHLTHQVQPLHYPSSTPTQFAPGLQRITSPLLLSTALSVSNSRAKSGVPSGTLSAVQAAGALENMSNELGPSATFHSSSRPHSAGVSLTSNDRYETFKKESPPLISALNNSQGGSNSLPPKLPSLVSHSGTSTPAKSALSPSFGPQFSIKNPGFSSKSPPHSILSNVSSTIESKNQSPDTSITSLPPIQNQAGKASLPSLQNSASGSHEGNVLPSISSLRGDNHSNSSSPSSNREFNNPERHNDDDRQKESSGDGQGRKPPAGLLSSSEDVTSLKTRISELELVNDLYRTRIMELEAMEQAARLRENSMKRRLDEILGSSETKKTKFV